MRAAIVYASLSGNTEEVAQTLYDTLSKEMTVDLIRAADVKEDVALDHDHVYFGTYTWGDGQLPAEMRKALRYILKGQRSYFQFASVFGTGDKQFPKYCQAVDEIMYHLGQYKRSLLMAPLKIEQSPRNRLNDIERWGEASIFMMNERVFKPFKLLEREGSPYVTLPYEIA